MIRTEEGSLPFVTLQLAAICAERLVPAERVSLLALEAEPRPHCEVVVCRGDTGAVGLAVDARRYPEICEAVDSRALVIVDDVHGDPRLAAVRDRLPPEVRSVLAVPIGCGDAVLGVLHARSSTALALADDARAVLLEVARSAGLALAEEARAGDAPRDVQGTAGLLAEIERMQRLLLARDEAVARFAHDLRESLNVIFLTANLLLRGVWGDLSGPQSDVIEKIKRHGRRMTELVAALQDGYRLAGVASTRDGGEGS